MNFSSFKCCNVQKDGKPYLAGDEVTGTITAKFKKDVKVEKENYDVIYETISNRSTLYGFLHLSQLQLVLTLELPKEMSRDIQRCLKNTILRKNR